MEKITIREVINNEARKAGVQNSRIWSDYVFDNFPEKGEFVGWSVGPPKCVGPPKRRTVSLLTNLVNLF